ncbi:MAG: tetratricopeptide repeat protein [Candidatus Uhrbacteria bacterium]|nr:tetratricopeptide repeat protein [Candidatus Uhrbacteria bacterium]
MSTKLFEHVTRWVTYLLLFLIPLFFLPWSQDVLEPNKQMVLVVLTVIGLASWFGAMVTQKRCEFRSGLVNVTPAAFLLIVLVSSCISKASYQTWVGQSSQEYVSFLTTAILVCVFYVFANVHKDVVAQGRALFALLLSAAIAGIFSTLQLFHVFLLPFAFTKSIAFNSVGTFNSLTLFLLVSLFLGLSIWLVSHEGTDRIIPTGTNGILTRVLIFVILVTTIISLVAADYWVFWVLTIVGVLLLTSFGFLQTKEFPSPRKFFFPLVLLLFSLFFLFLPSPFSFKLPLLVSPSFGTSLQIVKSTLTSRIPSLFFGSGPGTFSYQYLLYKPIGVNASPLWSLGLDRASSVFLTRLSDLGLFGSLVWLLCMGWIGFLALKRLVNVRNHQTWKMTYVLFVGWSLLIVSQFLSSSNVTLEFLLWALSGMLVAHLLSSEWKTDFARSPKLGLLASFAFVFIFTGMFVSVLLMGEKFLAEKAFVKAVALDAKQADIQVVIKNLLTATQFNSLSDTYARNLSFALLTQASQKIQATNGQKMTADQTKQISQIVTASVQEGTRAVQMEPNKVGNWEVLGSLYREVMPYAQNAEDLSANAFTNAIHLEPINPAHPVDLARVYLAVSERAKALKASKDATQAKAAGDQEQKLLASAEDMLNQAIKLKGDYLPAHYYLAATYEREGKIDQATARLVALTKNSPTDVGLGFELAQLYIRTKNFDGARQELERLIVVNPKYANALWYLASVYEIQGNHDKAIELVKKVVDLNPDSKVAQDRLQKLQAGQTTTAIPEPIAQDGSATTDAGTPAPQDPKKK